MAITYHEALRIQDEDRKRKLGSRFADWVEGGAQNLMIGAARNIQRASQDQEGWADDALRLVGGGAKNIAGAWQAGTADQEGIGDDILRGVGWTAGKGLQALDAASYYGGWAGGKLANSVGLDPRIGGAIGNIAGDAIIGGAAWKGLRMGAKGLKIGSRATNVGKRIPGVKGLLDETTGLAPRLRGLKHLVTKGAPEAGAGIKIGAATDPLRKSAQQISEILPHKSLREAGGVGARNLHQAKTVQKLIVDKIKKAADEAPNVVREMFEEIWPHVDADKLTVLDMKRKLTKALGSKTKAQGIQIKDLDRGLAEILTGRPEFLDDIGVIKEVMDNPSVLEPKNISKWLGAIDSRLSSTKSGIALHHTHLTSSKDLLDPSNVSPAWREAFLKKVRKKFTPGAEGIVKQDALAHKPFSSPKIKGKTDSSKWNVKGVLGDVLDEFTDLPKSTTGDIMVNKELGKLGNYSKGLEGQLQKVIRSINEKAAHAHWSRGTTGWSIDPRLGKFLPEDAFKVAEGIFDLERAVSAQGIEITHKLNSWKKAIGKGKFGQPPNLEKAIANLQSRIDNIKIDDLADKVKNVEAAYKHDLEALLGGGIEALKGAQLPSSAKQAARLERKRLKKLLINQ